MSFLTEALERQLRKLKPELAPAAPKAKVPVPTKLGAYRAVHLVFQEGSSDKEYLVQIIQVGSLYDVRFEYGRRGGTHQKGTKNDSPLYLGAANALFNQLVSEKKKKGYKEI